MPEIREPRVELMGGKIRLYCTTERCEKMVGKLDHTTRLRSGWIDYFCRRCKTDYRVTPSTLDALETPERAAA